MSSSMKGERTSGPTVAEQLSELGTLELLWLPGNLTADGSGHLTSWADVSGNGNDGSTESGTPDVLTGNAGVNLVPGENISFTRISTIRTVIWRLALRSRPASGAQARLLLGDSTTFDFYGGEGVSGPVFSVFAAAGVQAGAFKVDGTTQTSTSYVLPANIATKRTLSLVTTANARANQFSRDRVNASKDWDGHLYALAIYSTALSGANVSIAESLFNAF